MIKTLIQQYAGLILLSVSALVGIGIVVQYILPKYDEIQGLRQTIETQKTQRDELVSYVGYLEELASSTLEVEEEIVSYALPSENDVVSLIVTYEGLGKMENVLVSPFNLSPGLIRRSADSSDVSAGTGSAEAGDGLLKELEFEMKIETEDNELALAFIREIYKTRRVFTIKSLTWDSPTEEDPPDTPIAISFQLATYYFASEPIGVASETLVKKGQTQTEFINMLKESKVYEQLVLDSVIVGKEDVFTLPDGIEVRVEPNVITQTVKQTEESTVTEELRENELAPTEVPQQVVF